MSETTNKPNTMSTKKKAAAKKAVNPSKTTPTPAPASKTVSTVKKAKKTLGEQQAALGHLPNTPEEPAAPTNEEKLAHALNVAATPPPAPVGAPPIAMAKPAAPPIEIVPDTAAPGKKRYISKTAPNSKYHLRDRSTAEAPVSIVKHLSQQGLNEHWTRKQVLDACIAKGVNKNTAATQYAVFHKKIKDEAERQRLLEAAGEAGGDENEE